jgi:hypothetical protein
MIIPRFPDLPPEYDIAGHRRKEGLVNPAIQVYGRRFYKNQTEIEYLVEFLLVFIARKWIDGIEHECGAGFPDNQALFDWPERVPLVYYPPARLILKLFTFLGSSQLESRHDCHKKHFKEILQQLKTRIEISSALSKEQVLTWIEQILVGFVGVAQNRAWCTHSFLPVSSGLIAGETVWESSRAKQQNALSWRMATQTGMFSFSKHVFLGRGGELLYLQLCNLFRRAGEPEIMQFEHDLGHTEGTARSFQAHLQAGLQKFLGSVPVLDTLAHWVEQADPETQPKEPTATTCGWCPVESWKETYLFAYEMANICDAMLDPLEKVEMLKLCCVLQVMRTLCAQASRHWESLSDDVRRWGGSTGFAWIVTAPEEQDRALKEAARRNVIRIQEMIHGVLRHSQLHIPDDYKYKNTDDQGQELFLKLGKKIGFIVPWKGPGARLVLTEALLRYFVLALVPPGNRMTLASFKACLFRHYGIGVNGEYVNNAIRWTYPNQMFELRSIAEDWLEEKLRATGFLIPLADAISLVHNPFGKGA